MLDLLDAGLPAPAVGCFSTRAGGVSTGPYAALNLGVHVEDDLRRVKVNRSLLAAAAGLGVEDVVHMQQVHGAEVAVVDRTGAGARQGGVPSADALVTSTPGLGLAVLAADCLPVLLADPVARVVGAAHAGRQGLVAGVLHSALAAMVDLGATAACTTAVVGPSACGRCYEVPDAMADEVEAAVPGARSTTRQGTASVDLAAGAAGLLRAAGVRDVRTVGGCTIEQPDRWFSYRRDGVTGRHAGLVRLR